MKTKVIPFFMIAFATCKLFAQPFNFGTYNTSEDFSSRKISLACNCNSSDKIKLHHFFSKNYIDVIKEGKDYRLSKDSIFGYRDCEQNDYRFYKEGDKEYRILENNSIVIYTADEAVLSSSGKRMEIIHKYYFSTTLSSAIHPLTIINLKRAYPNNIKFHDMLEVTFGDRTPVSKYDEEHKMYKINYLLNQSTKN